MTGKELGRSNIVLANNAFALIPNDGRKSFYGKAVVYECKNGVKLLKSYSTIVCMIDENREFIRLWNGYSATTQRHVNAFLTYYGKNTMNKSEWERMEVC